MSLLVKGVTSFLKLTDTPVSYAGTAQKIAAVNIGESGLEFRPHSKFTSTKLFDGATASPPTIYTSPLTNMPYAFNYGDRGIYEFGAVIVGDWLYVFGGQYHDGSEYSNRCYRYHLTARYWERLANLLVNGHSPYKSTCAGYHNGKLYFASVFNSQNWDRHIRSYDIASNSWADEGAYTPLSQVNEICLFCCADALYLHQSHTSWGQRLDKMDYATKAWTNLTAFSGRLAIGGVIGDEIYAVRMNNRHTYLYNKGGDSWVDQSQTCPVGSGAACYDENRAAIWVADFSAKPYSAYRYTPVGGWVTQYTEGRQTRSPDWFVVSANTARVYCLFGYEGLWVSETEGIGGGCVHYFEPNGVWKLLTQTFNEGDLMVLYEEADIPVVVEKNGKPLFTGSGMDTVYIVAAGSYLFSLSQDFEKKSVQIWRSIWG